MRNSWKKFVYVLLLLIIVLASVLRLYRFTTNPPHLYWDEAAISYDAYSINQTNKDQWGDYDPFLFRSFGDYKLPFFIYLVALSQKIFGFDDAAVRIPSVIAGVLAVIGVFFRTQEVSRLFGEKIKFFGKEKVIDTCALLVALFLTISPWHLQFSRAGFEANIALTFRIFAVWLFLRAVRTNIKLLFLSVFFFAAAMYTYHSAVVTAPLLLLVLSVLFFKRLWLNRKTVLAVCLFGLIIIAPYVPSYVLSVHGRARFMSESIVHMEGNIVSNFINNYLGNFSLDYLFFHGDQSGRHSVKKLGELYVWQLPLVLTGIYLLLSKRSKASVVLLSGLLIAAIPPAVTRVSPHALRGLLAVHYWQAISAFGLVYLIYKFKKIVGFFFLPFIFYGLLLYLHTYYIHYPSAYALDWQDGHKETVEYLKTIETGYDQIFVENSFSPIYFFLYLPYSPKLLQDSGHNDRKFWKVSYVDFGSQSVKANPSKKSLMVVPYGLLLKNYKMLREIKIINGDVVFRIYEF